MDRYDATMILLARGGSKGLLNKNLQNLLGVPLVRRTTQTAINSGVFYQIIVSSDSDTILESVHDLAVTVHKRSVDTSSDIATSEDALIEVISDCNVNTRFCALMQCTTPFISEIDIKNVLKMQIENPEASVTTGYIESLHHWVYDAETGVIDAISNAMKRRMPRQHNQKLFIENGGIYSFPTKAFGKSKTRFMKKTLPYVMKKENSIDVDTIEDLHYAEFLLGK